MKTSTFRQFEYSKRRHSTRGFTLIELLVVIAIAAILTALLIGGFYQITASNRRSGCQVNMSQIYNALRLYANDYDGAYPYANETNVATIPVGANNGGVDNLPVDTMGLWKLYTTQSTDDVVDVASNDAAFRLYATTSSAPGSPRKFVGNYLRNPVNFHCPNDVNNESLFADLAHTQLNPKYLSYQTLDNGKEFFPASTSVTPTYQAPRTTSTADVNWSRQLMHWDNASRVLEKRPTSDTVVLWCKWHRVGLGGRQNDIVLFADGSVKTRPFNAGTPATQPQAGWLRTP